MDDSMSVIPFQVSPTEYSVFVVMGDGNLDRLKQYDPAELHLGDMPEPFKSLRVRDVILGYATKAEFTMIAQYAVTGKPVPELLRHLSRGFKYRPDRGDNDLPPQSLRPGRG